MLSSQSWVTKDFSSGTYKVHMLIERVREICGIPNPGHGTILRQQSELTKLRYGQVGSLGCCRERAPKSGFWITHSFPTPCALSISGATKELPVVLSYKNYPSYLRFGGFPFNIEH